jgi:phosphoglucosamine mutase
MSRKYFGTDGIRGKVGESPMMVDFTLRLASAAARVLAPDGGKVIIGKDTRVSGYMFESALEAGFVAAGVDVWLTGPIPTPGIAYLTRLKGDSFGVVISASHNPYQDNGIKFFDRTGEKLSDELEERIEQEMERGVTTAPSNRLGKARRADVLLEAYQDFCASTVPGGLDLSEMKLVIDCANGAGFKVGPRLLAALGADIIPVGCSPNGRNINDGSTAPKLLQLTVPGVGAAAGIGLDGDGDRLAMVDHLGRLVDGDSLLYIIARDRAARGLLQGPVVGTVMSNLGLELALRELGIGFSRAAVGDRYVLAMLKEQGGAIGERPTGAGCHAPDGTVTGPAGRRHAALSAGADQRAGHAAL